MASDKKALGEAQRAQRRALLAAQLRKTKQVEQASASAPDHLKALGLSTTYRLYADPSLVYPAAPDGSTPYLHDVPPASSAMVAASAAVLLVASPGLLSGAGRRLELAEAALRGARLVVVGPPGVTTLKQLLMAPMPGAAGSWKDSGADGAAAMAAQLETAPGGLPSQAAAYLDAAWEQRITADASSLSPTSGAALPLVSSVAAQLGLADAALRLLPLADLRTLSAEKSRVLPDLAHLNCVRLKHLRLAWPAAATAGADVVAAGGRGSLQLETLAAVLRGNTMLQALTLRGCPAADAPSVASLLEASSCPLATVTIGATLPLGGLLSQSLAPLQELDLCNSGATLLPQDCLLLAALLRHAPHLTLVALPAALANDSGSAAVDALAAGLASLPSLHRLNGLNLQAVASQGPVAGPVLLSRLSTAGGGLSPMVLLNLTGCELGALGATHLAAAALAAGGLQSLQTACLADNRFGPSGIACALRALLAGPGGGAGDGERTEAGGAQLAVLDLSLNGLGDDGCKVLAKQLHELPGLTCLALDSNNIQAEGARALAACVGSALQELRLAPNHMGDAAVASLCAVLPARLPALRSVHLQANHSIAVHGACTLGLALAATSRLQGSVELQATVTMRVMTLVPLGRPLYVEVPSSVQIEILTAFIQSITKSGPFWMTLGTKWLGWGHRLCEYEMCDRVLVMHGGLLGGTVTEDMAFDQLEAAKAELGDDFGRMASRLGEVRSFAIGWRGLELVHDDPAQLKNFFLDKFPRTGADCGAGSKRPVGDAEVDALAQHAKRTALNPPDTTPEECRRLLSTPDGFQLPSTLGELQAYFTQQPTAEERLPVNQPTWDRIHAAFPEATAAFTVVTPAAEQVTSYMSTALGACGTVGTELNRTADQLTFPECFPQHLATWSRQPGLVGLRHNRGALDVSGASGGSMPDLLYYLRNTLMFKGEHKKLANELPIAVSEIGEKVTFPWTLVSSGNLRYLLALGSAAESANLYVVMRNTNTAVALLPTTLNMNRIPDFLALMAGITRVTRLLPLLSAELGSSKLSVGAQYPCEVNGSVVTIRSDFVHKAISAFSTRRNTNHDVTALAELYAAMANTPGIVYAKQPPTVDNDDLYEVDLAPLGYRCCPSTEAELREQLKCVLPPLQEMHQQGFLHKDLRNTNFLRNGQGLYFLADLEGACRIADTSQGNRPQKSWLVDSCYTVVSELKAVGGLFEGLQLSPHGTELRDKLLAGQVSSVGEALSDAWFH